MTPAFTSLRQAAGFALLLGVLLGAPAVIGGTGLLDRASVYATIPTEAGPYVHFQRQIFEAPGDLDIAFVGSSFMWSAINTPVVRDSLSARLGRPATVTTLASVWPGLDRDYVVLRDLLTHRRVHMVVLQLPNRDLPTDDPYAVINRVTDEPHLRASRFYRVGELPEIAAALPFDARASLYAAAVVGLPRHLLSLVRADRTRPHQVEATLGARLDHRGYFGAPYEAFRPRPPGIAVRDMIYTHDAAPDYRFVDEPLPPYQMHFVRLMAALLRRHHLPAVILHVPQANERHAAAVEERVDWFDVMGPGTTLIGVPPARLYRGFSDAEIKRFYVSDHFNENGAVFFTATVLPALLELYRTREAIR
jgi:hypothetical protein